MRSLRPWFTSHRKRFFLSYFRLCEPFEKRSAVFLLEGCANGIRAGGGVAGADVDLFGGAGACAVMVYAIGYVAGNTVVFFAGFTGSFRGIVIHRGSSFQSKNQEDVSSFRTILFTRKNRFMQSNQGFSNSHSAKAEYITRATREYHLDEIQISHFASAKYITAMLKTLH